VPSKHRPSETRKSARRAKRLRSPRELSAAARPIGSQTSRSERRLIAAAFHEAGHAVAAYYVRVPFRRIAIGKGEPKELGWLELWLAPQAAADGIADVRTGYTRSSTWPATRSASSQL